MELGSKVGIAAVAAMAVIAGSAATASAASAPAQAGQFQATAVRVHSSESGVTVPLKVSPGTHMVAFRTPEAAARPDAPDIGGGNVYVNIRVGKNNCGGYKGNVSWGADLMGAVSIEATGTLWDNCNYYTPNTTVYLYISWTDTRYNNVVFASVTGTKNTENIGNPSTFTNGAIASMAADTCLKWNNGWGCGPSQVIIKG